MARTKTIQSSSKSRLQATSKRAPARIIGFSNEGISFLGIPNQSCLGMFPTQNSESQMGRFCTLKKDESLISNNSFPYQHTQSVAPKLLAVRCSWTMETMKSVACAGRRAGTPGVQGTPVCFGLWVAFPFPSGNSAMFPLRTSCLK